MSAKKVSKMCNFVHKSVENARFSPRKVQKRGFFAGGRGDFLAGQKRGFLGSRVSRTSRDASPFFVHVSRDRKSPRAPTTQKSYDAPTHRTANISVKRIVGCFRLGSSSNAPIAAAMDIGNVIDIRSLPKGRSLFNIF
jgi:hypothetical protein